MRVTRTLRCRIKDKHARLLSAQAREVNLVWNYCNDLSMQVLRREGRFIGTHEMQKYLAGATKEGLSLHSQTVQAIAEEYVRRRIQFKKRRLAWRKSGGARRSLGWIPFKASAIGYANGQIGYGKFFLSLWDSWGLSRFELGAGSISEDARGRWYINITVKVSVPDQPITSERKVIDGTAPSIGIDLGLKKLLATSDGETVSTRQFYRSIEDKLAIAQRTNRQQRVKALHRKAANCRHNELHHLSRRLVDDYAAIFVGNVNAAALARTRMSKSVYDAGWSTLRTMLRYKCAGAGTWFEEVDEAYSTQTCSACNSRTGPKGREGLGIREWTCACGATHDRDVNAARNILQRGHALLAEGILVL